MYAKYVSLLEILLLNFKVVGTDIKLCCDQRTFIEIDSLLVYLFVMLLPDLELSNI